MSFFIPNTPEGIIAFRKMVEEYNENRKIITIMNKARNQGEESLTEEELKIYNENKGKPLISMSP